MPLLALVEAYCGCFARQCLESIIGHQLSLVNVLPVVYHSIKFDPDNQALFQQMVDSHPPGTVMDMPVAPSCIIVEVLPPPETREDILQALRELSLEEQDYGRTRSTATTSRILLPIFHATSISWDTSKTLIRGSEFFIPSRAL